MNNNKSNFSLLLIFLFVIEIFYAQDWANLNKYKLENDNLGLPELNESRIVFMGNSITEGWGTIRPEFFNGKPYVNRGISGQTTPQMLLRFRADVINLKPKVVIILAGTNDIAGNTGPMTLKMIMNNIISMSELAKANNIEVIISSILPAYDYPWKPGLKPHEKIPALNALLKNYTEDHGIVYLDYFSSMVDDKNGLKNEYGADGVHPNAEGYKIMEVLVEKAIAEVLSQ
ncbi:MAG: SGNH/GDSL hydrolase family protein [Flavobacteriaceae bacterium]|nr:SGNH/GDSL hydrolase family protein [Flavobacteriaceae bacterium]